ncbi:hypothetical protein GFS24_05825 [Chitinophaga sp. SYP-B3965]|uniref:hypothetical protein n=1 Tax=Chitinophaga sp. SYP-B3965 TaxID=2663120 RepID=UPI0012997100|nr:hypothetical protein [Chitinophaga sp. SYP-B3965]MRG44621.1 hypothetical protein [Chitinophaga sp. SYP-B3965]
MKKTLLLACLLVLLVLSKSQSAPITTHPGNLIMPHTLTWNPVSVIAESYTSSTLTVTAPGVYRIMARVGNNKHLTPVYAKISHENVYFIGVARMIDVYVRFYDDAANEFPAYVSDLQVNYRVIGYDGSSGYDFNSYATAYGYEVVLATNVENDYQENGVMRYRDYHLLSGDYIPQAL